MSRLRRKEFKRYETKDEKCFSIADIYPHQSHDKKFHYLAITHKEVRYYIPNKDISIILIDYAKNIMHFIMRGDKKIIVNLEEKQDDYTFRIVSDKNTVFFRSCIKLFLEKEIVKEAVMYKGEGFDHYKYKELCRTKYKNAPVPPGKLYFKVSGDENSGGKILFFRDYNIENQYDHRKYIKFGKGQKIFIT